MPDTKNSERQVRFLKRIKDIFPSNYSLVDELSELLGISIDSVYRRMRGETFLTFDEIVILCEKYQIDFMQSQQDSGSASFLYHEVSDYEGLVKYLKDISQGLRDLTKAANSQIIYAAIDVPVFHFFQFKELTCFKLFYWMKAVASDPTLDGKSFSTSLFPEEIYSLTNQIYSDYCKIPSIEVWNNSTINSLITDIEFFWDSGLFENMEDALQICSQANEELENIQKQAESNSKAIVQNVLTNENFKLYVTDIEIGNNCIFTKIGENQMVYLSFRTFNKMQTIHSRFCNETERWLSNLMRKSQLISGVAEKQRYQFFKRNFEKINTLHKKIQSS
jgi:hypothetical protein